MTTTESPTTGRHAAGTRHPADIAYRVAEHWDRPMHNRNAKWAHNYQVACQAWALLNYGSMYRSYVTSHAAPESVS